GDTKKTHTTRDRRRSDQLRTARGKPAKSTLRQLSKIVDENRVQPQMKLTGVETKNGETTARVLGKGSTTRRQVALALLGVIAKSGTVGPLDQRLHRHRGPVSILRTTALLVSLMLVAYHGRRFSEIEATEELAKLDSDIVVALGCFEFQKKRFPGYQTFSKQCCRMLKALEQGWDHCQLGPDGKPVVDENDHPVVLFHCDLRWLQRELLSASIPEQELEKIQRNAAGALDDTFVPSPGRIAAKPTDFDPAADKSLGLASDPDGAYAQQLMEKDFDEVPLPPEVEPVDVNGALRPGMLGPDGRRVWSHDTDARIGYRTATENVKAGLALGYEAGCVVAVQRYEFRGDPSSTAGLGESVSPYILACEVQPAGNSRGALGMRALDTTQEVLGKFPEQILADMGYTLMRKDNFNRYCHERGARLTMDHTQRATQTAKTTVLRRAHQKGSATPITETVILNRGTLLHQSVPIQERVIEGASRLTYCKDGCACPSGKCRCPGHPNEVMQQLNQRARTYRWSVAGRLPGGRIKFRCPLCAGRAANKSLSKRSPNPQARNVLAGSLHRCCHGSMVLGPEQLDDWQETPAGTAAWWTDYYRRLAVERANARFRNRVSRVDPYLYAFGLARHYLAVTLAAVVTNVELTLTLARRAEVDGGSAESKYLRTCLGDGADVFALVAPQPEVYGLFTTEPDTTPESAANSPPG
ncbi:MAG: hypothetical protein ACYDBS_09090, partial [Acidimicrobiales bacterium]